MAFLFPNPVFLLFTASAALNLHSQNSNQRPRAATEQPITITFYRGTSISKNMLDKNYVDRKLSQREDLFPDFKKNMRKDKQCQTWEQTSDDEMGTDALREMAEVVVKNGKFKIKNTKNFNFAKSGFRV